MADTPGSAVKQSFITALRDTPAGIAGFLTAAIPEPPECSEPTGVDDAIVVNGLCAFYVLELFRAFAGVTPVELLLRIGQHNSVMESALLAGLQYLAESQAAPEFEIVEPTAGQVLLPGELRITARSKNETVIKSLAGTLGEKTFQMKAVEGVWRQYVTVSDGEQTLTLTATFAAGDPLSQTVNFLVSAEPVESEDPEEDPIEPEPPEGEDLEALQRADTLVQDAYAQLMESLILWSTGANVKDAVIARYQNWKSKISVFYGVAASVSASQSAVMQDRAMIDNAYPSTAEAIFTDQVERLQTNLVPSIQSVVAHTLQVITAL